MRKWIAGVIWVSVIAGIVAVAPSTPVSAFSGSGSGNSGSPYQVNTCDRLAEMSAARSAYYILTADIDCTGTSWSPVGMYSSEFTGNFNGQGHTISHLNLGTSYRDNGGLFGATLGATISNIQLGDVVFNSHNGSGSLIGYCSTSTISKVRVTGLTMDANGSSNGGIMGVQNGCTISQSSVTASTITGSSGRVGGLSGWINANTSSITDSLATATLTGSTEIGGIAGKVSSAITTIARVYSGGTITATGGTAGGLFGAGDSDLSVSNAFTVTNLASTTTSPVGGAFGNNVGPTSGVYFDKTKTGKSVCTGSGSATCTAVNTTGTDNARFYGTNTVAPLTGFSFGTGQPWHLALDAYPTLTPLNPPSTVCYAPTRTAMTATASCFFEPTGWGIPTWEAEYRKAGTSTWIPLTLSDTHVGTATATQLDPATDYEIHVRYTTDYGTSSWVSVSITTLASTDRDNDGIADAIEQNAPNGGDANNDGIRDIFQPYVGSYLNTVTGKYATLASSNTACTIGAASSATEAATGSDTTYDYPLGLMNFTLSCGSAGANTIVTQYYYEPAGGTGIVRKYNPTTHAYTTINGSSVGSPTIAGIAVRTLSYTIADGGSLDNDGVSNGTIVDPAGLAVVPGTPATGLTPTPALIGIGSGSIGLGALVAAYRRRRS